MSVVARSLRLPGMYSVHSTQALSNGGIVNGMDASGTINPAALNSAGMILTLGARARANSPAVAQPHQHPREMIHSPARASVTSAAARLGLHHADRSSIGLVGPLQPVAQQPSRGIKRSRSPENSYGDLQTGENGEGR